jgi:hypothetical protein
MDILIALGEHQVSGGKGGVAGKHGRPGFGGPGGKGGAPYSWCLSSVSGLTYRTQEEVNDVNNYTLVTHYMYCSGRDGCVGQTGVEAKVILKNGRDGANGSFGIYIADQKGHITGPFSSAFKLELVDFDIIDGNEDGIYEFGEEIILRNIRVKNVG